MKVGDLVRQKDPFADWLEDNPWMESKEHTGVVVEIGSRWGNKKRMIAVYWFIDGIKWWCKADKIEVIDESR